MAVFDRLAALSVAATLWAVAGGCSSAPEMELGSRPTEAMEQIERTKQAAGAGAETPIPTTPTETAPAEAESSQRPAPIDKTKAVHFPTTKPQVTEEPEPTLVEAAEAERIRRQGSPQPALVITDQNLAEYAKGGQLSEMITEGYEESDAEDGAGASAPGTPAEDQETYWRTRVRDSRLAWRAAADRVKELESLVAQLRYDFYSQDDPTYRDLEIKPAWDRAAVDLTQARLRASDLEIQVETVLAEGVEAGALPGWLRDGIDFEPETEEDVDDGQSREPETTEVIEPPIMEDPPR